MSGWTPMRMTVTLASDLHCGDRPLGFVARTWRYVPAHLPWYATVAALTRLRGLPHRYDSYRKVEEELEACLRFTPLYLLDGDEPLFPWKRDQAAKVGERDRAAKIIEERFLASRYGVGIDYASRGAMDNRLFETEVILAIDRRGMETRLSGLCFLRSGRLDEDELARALDTIRLGGQGNKGWGELRRVELERLDSAASTPFGRIEPPETFPRLGFDRDQPAPLALAYREEDSGRIRGKLRPLAGRRTSQQGAGLEFARGVVAWMPGWCGQAGTVTVELHTPRCARLA